MTRHKSSNHASDFHTTAVRDVEGKKLVKMPQTSEIKKYDDKIVNNLGMDPLVGLAMERKTTEQHDRHNVVQMLVQ